jgi:hypothetical protein
MQAPSKYSVRLNGSAAKLEGGTKLTRVVSWDDGVVFSYGIERDVKRCREFMLPYQTRGLPLSPELEAFRRSLRTRLRDLDRDISYLSTTPREKEVKCVGEKAKIAQRLGLQTDRRRT